MPLNFPMFARVTFPISSFQTFTYSVPIEFQKQITKGTCVHTTMGKRKLTGYVVAVEKSASYSGKIKDILLKAGVPQVTDEATIEKVLSGKDVTMNDDGSYVRSIGGTDHTKILLGRPLV